MSSRRRRLRLTQPIDVAVSLRTATPHGFGVSARTRGPSVLRACRTPGGTATLLLAQRDLTIEAEGWGDGASWLLDRLPAIVGDEDRTAALFNPQQNPLRRLWRQHRTLRIPTTFCLYDTLLPTVLAQRVVGREAARSFSRLLRAYGEAAPGPHDLLLTPDPELLASLPYERFHPFGIEKTRAETLRLIASRARRLFTAVEALAEAPAPQTRPQLGALYKELLAIPGVGPWTAGKIGLFALGDPDTVWLGDYHLPHLVSWNLERQPRGNDRRLLELLEPYVEHRGRVLQLLELAGDRAPRYGPRLAFQNIEER